MRDLSLDIYGDGYGRLVPPDELWVSERAKLVYALSEGICKGFGATNPWKCIKLDGTPILAADGVTWNIRQVGAAIVHGTVGQKAIRGFAGVETEHSSGAEIKYSVPKSFTITDPTITSVRVKIGIQAFQRIDSKTASASGTSVLMEIDVDGVSQVLKGVNSKVAGTITGQTTSGTVVAWLIPLSGTGNKTIIVKRLTVDSASQYLQNKTYLSGWTEIQDVKLSHPHTAKLAVTFNAKAFSSIPKMTVIYKGRMVAVPNNYAYGTPAPVGSAWTAATYTGVWNGVLSTTPMWTDNPAWCFYDMATSSRFGAGRYLSAAGLDIWALYAISQYCDELVPDGAGGWEPRFRFNGYFTSDEEAFKVLAHMISTARAMLYYGGSNARPATSLTAVQDVAGSVAALFSPSNVIGGAFAYQGSSLKTRYTQITVWWNDPQQAYKLVPVLVQADQQYVARYGVQPAPDTVAFGCISQGQAIREGKRVLLTNLMETEAVTFNTGMEGIAVFPGDTIQVQDPARDLKRMSGRVTGSTTTTLTLDAPTVLAAATAYTLWLTLADGTVVQRPITTAAGAVSSVAWTVALPSLPVNDAQWQITPTATAPTKWRIIGIKEARAAESIAYEIRAVQSNSLKYSLMDDPGTVVPYVTSANGTAPVTGLTLTYTTAWINSSALNTIVIGWTMPTGATGATARVRRDSTSWSDLSISGTGASFDTALPGVYEVQVRALHPTGMSPMTSGTLTISGVASGDFITNDDQTSLIQSWKQELQTQIGLAASAGAPINVSHTAYDAAITALSDGLISFGAPATWASTWPDGTTLNHAGVQASLTAWWATIASTRTDLQARITAAAIAPGTTATTTLARLNSVDWLVGADKTALMEQWSSENATKAVLDTKAAATVPASSAVAYDASIAAIDSYLVTLVPTWKTLWPDVVELNVTGIKTQLKALWNTVATERMTLQNLIAQNLANKGSNDAISAAATDATNKSNAVLITVPKTVTGFPTLPSLAYPVGTLIYETGTKRLYRATLSNTWESATTAAADVTGTLGASQIGGVNASVISGQIADANLAAIAASKVTGTFTDAQLLNINAAKLGGTMSSSQIADLDAAKLTGTLAAARVAQGSLDTRISSITSAQIGGLDAAKLTGTLAAAQVAVGSLDAKISAIGNSQITALDGSKITSDTITANQIAASAITASELAAGAVIAGKILAGTIVAADIAASTITGAKIAGQTITASNLVADTITSNEIAANAITAVELAAGSIFAKHLTIANFDNLIPNPNSLMGTAASGLAPEGNGLTATASSRSGGWCRTRDVIGAIGMSALIPCVPGDVFYLEAWGQAGQASETGAGPSIYMSFSNASGMEIATTGSTFPALDWNGYKKGSTTQTAPAGAVSVSFNVYVNKNGVTYYFDDFYARRCADANLIVDGAITAGKMAVGSITAANAAIADAAISTAKIIDASITTAKIANLAVDTAQIKDGAIVNAKITNLDAGKITTGYLAAGRIDVGTITGDKIASNTITAQQLTIANFDNLIPNANSESGVTTGFESAGVVAIGGHSGSHCRAIYGGGAGTENNVQICKPIPVMPGEQYYLEWWGNCWNQQGNTSANWGLLLNFSGWDSMSPTSGYNTPIQVQSGYTWVKHSLILTIPAATTFLTIYMSAWNMPVTEHAFLDDFYLRRMADGNLIVDGAITTQKMTAGTINADRLIADSITAGQIAVGAIGADELAAGSVTTKSLTVTNFDNLIPNPNSEMVPTGANWGSSYEASHVTSAIGRNSTKCRAHVGQSGNWDLSKAIPCTEGDQYVFGCWVLANAGYDTAFQLYFTLQNSAGAEIAGALTPTSQASAFWDWNLWRRAEISVTIPAGVSFVAGCVINGTSGLTYYCDDFYMRKMIDSNVIVDGAVVAKKLEATLALLNTIQSGGGAGTGDWSAGNSSNGPSGFKLTGMPFTTTLIGGGTETQCQMELGGSANIGGYLVGGIAAKAANALSYTGSGSTFRCWYRGSNDPLTNGGRPVINGNTALYCQAWAAVSKFDIILQPASNLSNFDSMRYAKVELFSQNVLYTGSNQPVLTQRGVYYVPLCDRSYANTTDSDAANAIKSSFLTSETLSGSGPAAKITLYNAAGSSDTNCFYAATGWSAGSAITNNGTDWPGTFSGASAGGSGSGSGGGDLCPAPDVPLLMADGSEVLAGYIAVGDLVQAWDKELGCYTEEAVSAVSMGENLLRNLVLGNGRSGKFAVNHRFLVDSGEWIRLEDLKFGDTLHGGVRVLSNKFAGHGKVVQITVNRVHTYITLGAVSHNMKPRSI